jgi:hypothetical protein
VASRYLSIRAVQHPFDIGPDNNSRPQVSCNYEVTGAAPISNLAEEVMGLIVAAGLGIIGTTIFKGRAAIIPTTGDGPFTQIIVTSGYEPFQTHNNDRYERPTFQVVVRAKTYTAAETRALAVYRLLDGQHNVTVA